MTPSLRSVLTPALLVVLVAPPLLSQQPLAPAQEPERPALARGALDPASPDLAEELARLNRTLTRIADALERQAEGQRLDLALSRVAVESERVTNLERELQSAQATRTSLENEQFSISSRLGGLAYEVEASPDADATTLKQIERMTEEAQRMLNRIGERIDAQDRKILELQNELTRRRADLQALQDRLDRQLDGM